MPNYFIAVCTRSTTNKLDLEKILEKKSKKLELIDTLTSSFQTESQLKQYLAGKGIIRLEDMEKDLKIVYQNDGKLKRLPVFYSEHKKIIESFDKIKNKIYNREKSFDRYTSEEIIYRNLKVEFPEFKSLVLNKKFLKSLVEHYTNESIKYNGQGLNIRDINMYLSDVRSNGGNVFNADYMYIALYDLFKNAIFRYDKKSEELKQNYRGYRDLVNFIYKYKTEAGLIKEDLDETKQMTFKDVQSDIVKKDRKVQDEEYVRYEEGFPPNSEELKNYEDYLNNLPDEFETGKKR